MNDPSFPAIFSAPSKNNDMFHAVHLPVNILYINVREYRRHNQNGQSRETGNIGYTRRRQKKQKHNTIYNTYYTYKLYGRHHHLERHRRCNGYRAVERGSSLSRVEPNA